MKDGYEKIDKVLKKIGMQISKSDIEQIVNCAPNAIEPILKLLQAKLTVAKSSNKEFVADKTPTSSVPPSISAAPAPIMEKAGPKGSPPQKQPPTSYFSGIMAHF